MHYILPFVQSWKGLPKFNNNFGVKTNLALSHISGMSVFCGIRATRSDQHCCYNWCLIKKYMLHYSDKGEERPYRLQPKQFFVVDWNLCLGSLCAGNIQIVWGIFLFYLCQSRKLTDGTGYFYCSGKYFYSRDEFSLTVVRVAVEWRPGAGCDQRRSHSTISSSTAWLFPARPWPTPGSWTGPSPPASPPTSRRDSSPAPRPWPGGPAMLSRSVTWWRWMVWLTLRENANKDKGILTSQPWKALIWCFKMNCFWDSIIFQYIPNCILIMLSSREVFDERWVMWSDARISHCELLYLVKWLWRQSASQHPTNTELNLDS